ncbi:MAG: hypothetical protein FWH18_04735 [Marinilabiliaceae bacterium]|nr:hypothetical protein [Marinilabiliaceae bacterium]
MKSTLLELEAQKASLARQILSIDNQTIINNVWLMINGDKHNRKHPRREIGFLDGKAKVIFHDDWEMTPEELGMV